MLGCRVNHAERREIESVLRARGLQEAAPGCRGDIEIIHTCSVTGRAAAKSRQAARRASRREAGAPNTPIVLVTGCLVGSDPEVAQALAQPAEAAFGHDEPLPEAIAAWLDTVIAPNIGRLDRSPSPIEPVVPITDSDGVPNALPLALLPTQPSSHVRAEVRVQDGCDAFCTFCIIPRTRPVLRTKPVHIVLDEVSRLIDLGHQEIVLAGIFLGAYGHESALRRKQRQLEADPLADLVSAVATLPGLRRLRLSSLEPGDVTDELLDVYATHPKVLAPHLHLPLQSGSDEVLRRMNRQYRVGEYLELIDRVTATLTRNTLPPAITTDIICGFPGETDEAFQQTVEIVQRVGFLHMHVFPWSPRHGTAAARWLQDAAASPVVTKRVRDLMQMENAAEIGLAVAFRSRLIGREVRLFAEQPDPNRPGHWLGRCDHYALISVESDCKRGEFVRAIARRIEDDAIVADVVASRSLPVLNSN